MYIRFNLRPVSRGERGDGILSFFTVFMFNNNFENIVNTNMYFNYSKYNLETLIWKYSAKEFSKSCRKIHRETTEPESLS